jgi:hypothetical protein
MKNGVLASKDWQMALDRIDWITLMQIQRNTGIAWRERRLIGKFDMDGSVKIQMD